MWFKANKLSLNIKKTKFMVFHQPNCSLQSYKLSIDKTEIEHANLFKFLGLTITENMSWKPHISETALRVSRSIGILSKLRQVFPRYIILTLYYSLIMPHLTYHLIIWGHENEKLYKLQKKAIRLVTNTSRHSHTTPLFKSLHLLNLPDIHSLMLLKLYYKFLQNDLPEYFRSMTFSQTCHVHNHETRNRHKLVTPSLKHCFATKIIRHKIIYLVNLLPNCTDQGYQLLQKIFP